MLDLAATLPDWILPAMLGDVCFPFPYFLGHMYQPYGLFADNIKDLLLWYRACHRSALKWSKVQFCLAFSKSGGTAQEDMYSGHTCLTVLDLRHLRETPTLCPRDEGKGVLRVEEGVFQVGREVRQDGDWGEFVPPSCSAGRRCLVEPSWSPSKGLACPSTCRAAVVSGPDNGRSMDQAESTHALHAKQSKYCLKLLKVVQSRRSSSPLCQMVIRDRVSLGALSKVTWKRETFAWDGCLSHVFQANALSDPTCTLQTSTSPSSYHPLTILLQFSPSTRRLDSNRSCSNASMTAE